MGLVQRAQYALPISAAFHAAPAASTTYYFGNAQTAPGVNASITSRIFVPLISTIQYVVVVITCVTPGSAEQGTISLRLNNTTDFLISNTVQWNATLASAFNAAPLMTDEVSSANGDWVEMKVATPAWLTPPLNVLYTGLIVFSGDL